MTTEWKMKSAIYLAILAIFASILVGANSVLFAEEVGRRSDRHAEQLNQRAEEESRRVAQNLHNFCDLLGLFDGIYKQTPPTTPAGIKVAAAMRKLDQANCG